MKQLYAPWRSDYVESEEPIKKENATSDDCIFCDMLHEHDDEKNLIIKRFPHCFIILNKYPYNAGHMMVMPLMHVRSLSELSHEVRAEIMELVTHSMEILTAVQRPHGFNIGVNIGKASGAGIPSHLHAHVLPRWNGDTNFLPTLANTKTISFDLTRVYADLKPYFEKIRL